MTTIEEVVRDAIEQRMAAVEEACERMLVSPTATGVRIDTWQDGGWSVRLWTERPYVISEYLHEGAMPDVLVR